MTETTARRDGAIAPWAVGGAVGLLAFGCVTINIHFPEREIRQAAEEIVEEVRPEVESGAGSPPRPEGAAAEESLRGLQGAARGGRGAAAGARLAAAGLWSLVLPAVLGLPQELGEDFELEISTPKIGAIKKTLKKRYPKLFPHYAALRIGESMRGLLEVRSEEGLDLKGKRDLRLLVEEENKDRLALYTEIARANRIDEERIPDIGRLFAEEWQEKSKTGWWIQVPPKGEWIRKPPPKKEGEKEEGRR